MNVQNIIEAFCNRKLGSFESSQEKKIFLHSRFFSLAIFRLLATVGVHLLLFIVLSLCVCSRICSWILSIVQFIFFIIIPRGGKNLDQSRQVISSSVLTISCSSACPFCGCIFCTVRNNTSRTYTRSLPL